MYNSLTAQYNTPLPIQEIDFKEINKRRKSSFSTKYKNYGLCFLANVVSYQSILLDCFHFSGPDPPIYSTRNNFRIMFSQFHLKCNSGSHKSRVSLNGGLQNGAPLYMHHPHQLHHGDGPYKMRRAATGNCHSRNREGNYDHSLFSFYRFQTPFNGVKSAGSSIQSIILFIFCSCNG